MQPDRRHHSYERQIRDLHDHLYGNANVRTPEGIAGEVLKVLATLIREPGLDDGVAATRAAFARMNADLGAHPAGTTIDLDDRSLAAVRAHLAGFDFAATDAGDWLGDAIEIFRHLAAKRLGGQFFTHPLVTELAMTLLRFSPAGGDDLVDVCAGTGGFLLAAAGAGGGAGCLWGVEADAELARLCNSNLAMRTGERVEFVTAADSLAPPAQWPKQARARVGLGRHRCLASNPPFGSRLLVRDEHVLGQFELARRWRRREGAWDLAGAALAPRAPEVLFVERNLQLAEPGRGRVALVTPYQLLSGPAAGFVREWLLRHARVLAVVDLPAATFQPHTGTKASLLVFERREAPLARWDAREGEGSVIFMAVAEHIGHDRRGQPVFDGPGEERLRTDLPAVARAFEAFATGGDPSAEFDGAFVVPSTALTAESGLRLNAAFHRPATAALRRSVAALGTRPGWRLATVGEVSEAVFVPGRFKRRYLENGRGIPLLGGTQIGQFVPSNAKRLDPRDPHAAQCVVRAGWILITRSGSTGLVSSVAEPWDGWAVSDHVIRVVPDPAKLDPGYLEAYLRSAAGQRLLAAGIFGSVIDEITPEHVASLPIPVPTDARLLDEIAEQMRRAAAGRTAAHAGIAAASGAIEGLLGDTVEG